MASAGPTRWPLVEAQFRPRRRLSDNPPPASTSTAAPTKPQSQVGELGGIAPVKGSVPPVQGTVTLAEAVAGPRVAVAVTVKVPHLVVPHDTVVVTSPLEFVLPVAGLAEHVLAPATPKATTAPVTGCPLAFTKANSYAQDLPAPTVEHPETRLAVAAGGGYAKTSVVPMAKVAAAAMPTLRASRLRGPGPSFMVTSDPPPPLLR